VSAAALAIVLASAALHAAWNTLMADARDTHALTAVMLVAGVVALAPAAAVTWDVDWSVAPFAAASVLLELAYFAALASAYAAAGLTTVYPVARGAAPVIALVASVALLSAPVSVLQAAGVVAVGAGVLLVRGARRPRVASLRVAGPGVAGLRVARLSVARPRGGLPLALAIAACIAGYTLVDDRGVRHAAALPYFEIVLGVTATAYLAAIAARRGWAPVRAAVGRRALLAGVGMAVAYVLVLVALERAEAAPVAAVRETGVVMATAAAALAGRERVPPARLAGAAVVVAGVAVIALG
jgi:drug/metabolite transporter (DMT)-like permease